MSRHPSKTRAIRSVLGRLGFHAPPGEVVSALAERGIEVSVGLVQKVKVEIGKDTGGFRRQRAKVKQVVPARQWQPPRKQPRSK